MEQENKIEVLTAASPDDTVDRSHKNEQLDKMHKLVQKTKNEHDKVKTEKPIHFLLNELSGKNKKAQANIQEDMREVNCLIIDILSEMEKENAVDRDVVVDLSQKVNHVMSEFVETKSLLLGFVESNRVKLNVYIELERFRLETEFGLFDSDSKVIACLQIANRINRIEGVAPDDKNMCVSYLLSRGYVGEKPISTKKELRPVQRWLNRHIEEAPALYAVAESSKKYKAVLLAVLSNSKDGLNQITIQVLPLHLLKDLLNV